jgi:hypothetical protein
MTGMHRPQWESPGCTRLFGRLAAFSRLIRFDKRGTGLSDRGACALKGVPGEWRLFALERENAR